ncbi:MAG: hypothetical protein M3065_02975 [Actinomycetota bacterium]|nr:hypothetical protein [Actinomycetota bacterium]
MSRLTTAMDALSGRLEEQIEQTTQVSEALAEERGRVRALEDELAKAQSRSQDLAHDLGQTQVRVEQLGEELARSQRIRSDVTETLAGVERLAADIDRRLAQLDVAQGSLLSRSVALERLGESSAGELADQRSQLEQLQRHVGAEAERSAALERELASMAQAREAVTLLQEQVTELEQRVRMSDGTLTAASDRVDDLESLAAEACDEAARLRADAETLKLEGERREVALEGTMAVLESDLAETVDLRSAFYDLTAERDELRRQLADAQERRDLPHELDLTRDE